jgi:hypothetical protein
MQGPIVKMYASPGIDSVPQEVGVFASGAGFRPDSPTFKAKPYDWANESRDQGYATGRLIGNFAATQAKNANRLKIRRRGKAPFGGTFIPPGNPHSQQHIGGITDMNPGASHLIAGGPGAASTFVRMNTSKEKTNRGAKLPVMPNRVTRGGVLPLPTGGGFDAALAAPLTSKVSGWPTIFSFRNAGANA